MFSNTEIEKKKELFKLPFRRDQLEYWGPVNNSLADSFLTMGHSFLEQYFGNIKNVLLKSIFSSFVEMVQNVAEYNEKEFQNNYPQSYVKLKAESNYVIISSANLIKEKDVSSIKAIFEKLFSLTDKELQEEHNKMLMKGGSLGLLMLRRLKNSTFEYNIGADEFGKNWLSLELIIKYGNT